MTALLPETNFTFLVKRTGLDDSTLSKRLHHRDCPPWEATKYDAIGRVRRLRLSPEAWAWLQRPLAPRAKNNSNSPLRLIQRRA